MSDTAPLKDGLVLLLEEAMKLRHEVQIEHVVGNQGYILDTLLAVRVRVDRVEELLGRAMIARGAVGRATAHQSAVVADAYDTALTRQRKAPVSLDGDYMAAKERYAMAHLETLELRQEERRLKEMLDYATEVTDLIKINYRGLTDLRQDLLTMLRAAQFETTLDR